MAPNTAPEIILSHVSRPTVAKRKEANELRKTLKPLLEKRRRARINESLNHLKTVILPLLGKDNSRYSKLEKADILEMTVRFLRDLPSSTVKSPSDSYKEGYRTCLQRVSTLLSKTNLLDKDTCQRVDEHIQQSMSATEVPCQNCSSQKSRLFAQINQKTVSLKSPGSFRIEATSSSNRQLLTRPQPVPQPISANVWRPW